MNAGGGGKVLLPGPNRDKHWLDYFNGQHLGAEGSGAHI